MLESLSHFLDKVSSFLANRKGLLPLIGLVLILVNFILQFVAAGWLVESNLFLHLGLLLAIIGFMLAWAL
ncbi:hypothetical protein [Bellilinea sp.]|uniref:hypothetical protein n=1 Tax=Bellilinea sp. TaxID=2838785 RepID=UPI002ADD5D94|nr:hypothetical protein [Bellilinea sp.]